MNFTLTALRQLNAEAQVIRHRAALPPVDAPHACSRLGTVVRKLHQDFSAVKLERPKLNAENVWSAFAASKYDLNTLDGLQFRTLCSDEKTALRAEFVAALVRDPEKLRPSKCLHGIVFSYFRDWRTMKDPSRLEGLLTSVFASYRGRNPAVKKWQSNQMLFSELAPVFVSNLICQGRKAVDDVLKSLYIEPLTSLGMTVRASAAQVACRQFREQEGNSDNEWSLAYLQWMTESVLSKLTLPGAFYECVASLILSESARRSEPFRRGLVSWIQKHERLGDPRARETSMNWRSVTPDATQRFLAWLAHDYIVFFFNTILPDNSENQRRKDFWLRYHGRIADFQVALSEADLWKVQANQNRSELLYYSHVLHPTTSAFLMKFEGYGGQFLIVEFSETGNAASIFRFQDFEAKGVSLRTQRFEPGRHFRTGRTDRILHPKSDWESAAAYKLSSEFGIRP